MKIRQKEQLLRGLTHLYIFRLTLVALCQINTSFSMNNDFTFLYPLIYIYEFILKCLAFSCFQKSYVDIFTIKEIHAVNSLILFFSSIPFADDTIPV